MLSFGVKFIKLTCKLVENKMETDSVSGQTVQPINALEILMQGQRCFAKRKCHESGGTLNKKDELYNDLVQEFEIKKLQFDKTTVLDEGSYIIQVITNSLWYITNQHQTIYDASLKRKDVTAFEKYHGYNDVKGKKMKSQPLNQSQLDSHSQALFSILTRPIFGSSKEWVEYKTHITALANCLHNYKVYLDNQLTSQQHRQSLEFPSRTVGSDISVEFRKQNDYGVKQKYSLFDQDVKNAKIMEPVTSMKTLILKNLLQIHIKDIHFLSVPIDLFRYCPGGSVVTITFAAMIDPDRDDKDKVTQPFRVVQQVIESLPVYHTRAQKRQFKQKLENIAKIKPAIADFIYKELALDASAASHPETQQRLNVIALGNTEMVADLRSLNTGRPSDKYDTFFEKLEEEVEKVTAADDPRHGEAHLSNWISLQELIDTAAERCPDGTLIPSKTLVRIQFTPRNPYAHSALNFTGRIPVQYKIQKRQLRADHPDQHFCAAQFKYLKAKAVELGIKEFFCVATTKQRFLSVTMGCQCPQEFVARKRLFLLHQKLLLVITT